MQNWLKWCWPPCRAKHRRKLSNGSLETHSLLCEYSLSAKDFRFCSDLLISAQYQVQIVIDAYKGFVYNNEV